MTTTQQYQKALLDEIKDVPEEALPNLLQIIKLFKESVLLQAQHDYMALKQELDEWDQLSDEALTTFEKDL